MSAAAAGASVIDGAGPSTRNRCVPLSPFQVITESFPAWAAAATIAASDAGSARPSPPLNGANRPSGVSVAAEIQPIPRARQRHVEQRACFLRPRVPRDRDRRRSRARRSPRTAPRSSSPPNGAGNTRIGIRRPAAAPLHVHDEDDRELQPLGRVRRHQVDGVDGIDDGVRLVAARHDAREMIDDAAERRVAAILNPSDERADLLEVLACLPDTTGRRSPRRTPTLRGRDPAARRAAADRPAPARTRHDRREPAPGACDRRDADRRSPAAASGPVRAADRPRRQPLQRLVRQPDESRSQERRGIQLRLRPREKRRAAPARP